MRLTVANTDEEIALAWLQGDILANAGREALHRVLTQSGPLRPCPRAIRTALAEVLDPEGDSKMYLARRSDGSFQLVRRR
jgi:hypothetical protein